MQCCMLGQMAVLTADALQVGPTTLQLLIHVGLPRASRSDFPPSQSHLKLAPRASRA